MEIDLDEPWLASVENIHEARTTLESPRKMCTWMRCHVRGLTSRGANATVIRPLPRTTAGYAATIAHKARGSEQGPEPQRPCMVSLSFSDIDLPIQLHACFQQISEIAFMIYLSLPNVVLCFLED